ncbi:DUF4124 domain-containing protein [Vibrio casei]|uniref:DUF4124 domain-containing protein n=1 Tax=Vibrio casei TaxID=673372 RepID=A0A368LGH5_9VIBR|nr:DUF4124 domain-containing protein [Vibrio casei]RCS69215.1 DUF4124 domain-containing protein [Vibrio casei]SJN37875.1 hypothetical protein FM109_15170 [Vibrio casei]
MKYLYSFLSLIPFIFISPLLASEIYKWTDNKGVLHFSDTPPPKQVKNEETLKLPDIKTPAPAPQYGASSNVDKPLTKQNNTPNKPSKMAENSKIISQSKAESKAEEHSIPKKITITIENLVDDQTIRSSRGFITIQAAINRNLSIGEQLQLMLDRQPYGAPQTKRLWELENINRGTHIFSINIVESGKVIASSNPITVHLHRTTVK